MTLKQKAVKGVIWSAIESWSGQITQLLTFLLLARLLTPESFGLVSMSNIFIHFIQALISSGFTAAIIQRKEIEDEHLDTAFWSNIIIGAVLTLSGFLSAELFAALFKQPTIVPIIRYLSLTVLLSSFNAVQAALLNRQMHFRGLAIRRLGGSISGSIAGISLAFLGFGVWSLVAQTLVTSFVSVILLWSISPWRPGFKVSQKHFNDLFSFGINVVGIGILVFFNLRADDFMIGYFLGPVALGYYSVAYKLLVTISQLLGEVTNKVALPAFSKLQSEPEHLRSAFYTSTRLINTVAVPSFVGMALLAPEIVHGLFGEQWIDSIPVMQILAVVGIIKLAVHFFSPVIMAIGKPSWDFHLILVDTLMRVAGFAVSVQWGIVAVAFSIVITSSLFIPIRLWLLDKAIGVQASVYLRQYQPIVLPTVVMGASLIGVKHFWGNGTLPQVELFLCITVGIISYLASVWLFSPKLLQQTAGLIGLKVPAKFMRS